MNEKIEDFGIIIPGAKKDICAYRKSIYSIIEDEIKKEHIWPEPDYDTLIFNGLPYDVAYFQKTVRDSIPNKLNIKSVIEPSEMLTPQQRYVDTISQIRDIIARVTTQAEAISVYNKILIDPGYVCEGELQFVITDLWKTNPVMNKKLYTALFLDEDTYKTQIIEKARELEYHIPPADRSPKGFKIIKSTGKDESYIPYTYYVLHKGIEVNRNIDTRKDAIEWIKSYIKENRKQKLTYTPTPLTHIRRNGIDYRKGRNISGTDHIKTFSIPGGQFGNWMNQNDRQNHLNYSYDAFKDLANILKISDLDISLSGYIAIAYGARGRGNAAAHCEPGSNMSIINLTKTRGAGSFAHEWFHALDAYLAANINGCDTTHLSETANLYEPLNELVKCIMYKDKHTHVNGITEYYQNAKRIDTNYRRHGIGYWQDIVELTARAFESYIVDKLSTQKSDYLIYHADFSLPIYKDDGSCEFISAYPIGEERQSINLCFDKLFAELKQDGYLHDYYSNTDLYKAI